MNPRPWLLIGLLAFPGAARAFDTASCEGKRSWQRSIVEAAVQRWFQGQSRSDDLLELVQAEHGIVACSAGGPAPLRLHTPALPRGLEVDQLGAVLLANELDWNGLVPAPEEGLAGESFRVRAGFAIAEGAR